MFIDFCVFKIRTIATFIIQYKICRFFGSFYSNYQTKFDVQYNQRDGVSDICAHIGVSVFAHGTHMETIIKYMLIYVYIL